MYQDGSTPLFVACKTHRVEVAKLLLGAGANFDLATKVFLLANIFGCEVR